MLTCCHASALACFMRAPVRGTTYVRLSRVGACMFHARAGAWYYLRTRKQCGTVYALGWLPSVMAKISHAWGKRASD